MSSESAIHYRHVNKILSLKEEGDTSHINQSYDKYVGKSDKHHKKEGLGIFQSAKMGTKGIVDQWVLVIIGLYILHGAMDAKTWKSSFLDVNLDPATQVPFEEWCEKIRPFLQAGQSFKPKMPVKKYSLLPPFWQGMLPTDKKTIVTVIDSHGDFSVNCCMKLLSQFKIPLADQQKI